MAYPPLAISRRNRRRRRLTIFLIIAVLLALVALAVRYRTERRDVTDYLALAKDVADAEAELADSLGTLFTSLGSSERPELINKLDELTDEASALRLALQDQTIARPVAEAHGFLSVATKSWSDALTGIQLAILTILDAPDDPAGEPYLRSGFELLRVGDAAYAGFVEAIDRIDPDLVTWDYPPVTYVGEGRRLLYDATVLAERMKRFRQLGERHDIAVSATTDPLPVGGSDGFPIVPFSETMSVQVVVSNAGNELEALVPVTLRLIGRNAGVETIERTATIEELQPGGATTVDFADLVVPGGSLYELVVAAEIVEDSDPADNIYRLVFFRNEDS